MAKADLAKRRKSIIAVAVVVSILLYLAGVFSGLYANEIIKQQTKRDIQVLEEATTEEFESLQHYVDYLDSNLKNIQLEQTFMETLTRHQMCTFSEISLNETVQQLGFYWDRLPFRIEAYEQDNKLSEDYLRLKQQYTHLSIRTWILAKNQYDHCNTNVVHGLHFYSADCSVCVKQGEQIDELNKKLSGDGKDLIMFPIDFDSEETTIKNLKAYYGITTTPAVLVNDIVFQGRLFSAEELFNAIQQTSQP